jgi:ubiquinone/menaquinone biosynthesis C-methylase UbiE
MSNGLVFTGERFIPHQTDPILALEHYHRYYFASRFAQKKRVLDMACGEGYGSAFLSRYSDAVLGIDSDSATIDHARNKYSSIANLRFEAGRCEDSPREDHSFDMVVAFELLEHLDPNDQVRFLENVRRVLKQDGLFIFSSPDRNEYAEVHKSPNEFHKHEMTLPELRVFLSNYFKYVHLCAQRVLSLSTLWQLEGWQGASFNFCSKKDLLDDIPTGQSFSPPLYIVALCSNSPLPESIPGESNSFYLDISNSDQTKLSQWAEQLTAETLKGRKLIEDLQQQIKEQTESFRQELKERTDSFERELKERTDWAMSLDAQIKSQADFIETMKTELERRTQWALSLDSDIASERKHSAQEHANFLKEREYSLQEHTRAEDAHQELWRLKMQVSSSFLYRALAKIKLLPNIWAR